jgi:2-polyprenyl-3-methyl-5-hydroxy-6-metoxy-1,4-benzoquinol methylase
MPAYNSEDLIPEIIAPSRDEHLIPEHCSRHLSSVEKWWLIKFQLDFEKHRLSVIDQLIPYNEDSLKALDVGCAIGVFTNLLHQKGYEALGIDTNKELLTFAKNRYPHCTFKLMNAFHLGFSPSSFDFVLALELIEHLDNPYKLLKEIHQVLKEDGVILLSTPNRLSLEGARGVVIKRAARINWNAWDPEHRHVYTSIEITQLLRQFFKIESVVGYYYVPWIPCMKYDIVKKIGLDKAHYLAFENRILSMLGFITFIKGMKRKLNSVE